MSHTILPESKIARFLFGDTRLAPLWLLVRLYLGYEWILAGSHKFTDPLWIGPQAGTAVKGFLMGALKKMSGDHPDVSSWYGYFVEHFALSHTVAFSYLVTFGEIAVGIALILGFLVGVSSFFGVLMNYNFMLAGTVSINPVMILLGILLMLAWRTAGSYGFDRFLLPQILKWRNAVPGYK
ncbi:MAG: DoxX family membrane protein [Patescibacteria group bacterium]